ncbi:CamS family sex pheromone protein [Lysinibacillus xylanilyticus]|uniref:CamS family sex pheromone protein n=1 Tax=Lysinibacillus xylanilyticus TaxID=582475 RepID=A0ABT4ER16_9BACI|nr:CamS family sex pheromone protein [Lysinibacillus xylanilyticus]MCY9548109.1 CamS family sex pheromone protein [Lysinibacillus xylanilyticus]MED3804260.1 CamS family sex pheromone protein [Lysinibacillus xylanilyticus]
MNIKKSMLFFLSPLFLLASCSDDDQVNKNDEKMYASSIQKQEIYEIKQPAISNVSRGLIVNNMNNSLNVTEVEKGLMDLSVNYFPTKEFYMQEGQYLDGKTINKWLDRKSKEGFGLNPPIEKSTGDVLEDEKSNPKILSHVLEQNFVNKENGKVEGMSLAISLNEFYDIRVHDDKGLTYTDQVKVDTNEDKVNDVENYGKKIAGTIIKNIRNNNKIPNVPIYLTLYQESNKNDIIPGIFLAQTFIPEGEDKIDKWAAIDIKNYTFPSDSLYSLDKDTSSKLLIFKEDIQEGFKHLNPKIVGKLRYENGKLTELKIDVNVPLINDTELIGLLQLTSTKLNTILFDYIPISIRILDQNKDVGIVLWDPIEKQIYVTPI